jgi:four helix bundle protein
MDRESSRIRRFEDIEAWQLARQLTRAVYDVTRTAPFSRDFALCDQIRRASVSVMSNIAEGFERNSLAEFKQFLGIAKASCAEVRSILYLASDIGYLSSRDFSEIFGLAVRVGQVIGAFRSSIERRLSNIREEQPKYIVDLLSLNQEGQLDEPIS